MSTISPPPFQGIVQRVKGKMAAALGLVGQLFVGMPTDTSSPTGATVFGIFANAGVPTNGTSGTFAKVAPKGSLLVDTTNAVLYQNTNTQASPTWTALTTATGAGTYTGTFDGIVGGTTPAAGTFTTATVTGRLVESAQDGITASTTHSIAGGTALTKVYNEITTCANSGDAVTLAALGPGDAQIIFNAGANPAGVYPNASGVAIDGGSAGSPVTLTNAKRALFLCIATNKIISAQLGVVSA